jgi:hypothetical protein
MKMISTDVSFILKPIDTAFTYNRSESKHLSGLSARETETSKKTKGELRNTESSRSMSHVPEQSQK